jgi:transposase
MSHNAMIAKITVGLDLGDKKSCVYMVDAEGACISETTVSTSLVGLTRYFTTGTGWRVVMEVGTHSPWVSRHLEELGHEVIVANPSAMYGARRRRKRNDPLDAEFLARQGRADVRLLYPIQHRGPEAQQHLEIIRARDQLVQARTKLVNHVRGAAKAQGTRISKCSTEAFPKRAAAELPPEIAPAVSAVLEIIKELTKKIAAYDAAVRKLVRTRYPVARRLQQPAGVGPLTALAFVILVEDPTRFARSRDVGAYFGLVPRLDESSQSQPQLRISKAGDELGRRLLVQASHYILGRFGPDCDLRRHGEAIAKRGGKNAKKRAAVAVARKLAVLLHHLWVSEQAYDPSHQLRKRAA